MPDTGALGLPYATAGQVAQAFGRVIIEREIEDVTEEVVIDYFQTQLREDDLWRAIGPICDGLEEDIADYARAKIDASRKDYIILFTYEDGDPGVRLIRKVTEEEADDYLQKVQELYVDPDARLIEHEDGGDDKASIDDQIEEQRRGEV